MSNQNYRWITLVGKVAAHEIKDKRSSLTKLFARKFPSIKLFQGNIHQMIRVELDHASYREAQDRLRVKMLNAGFSTVPEVISVEVSQSELEEKYPVSALLAVTFGFAHEVAQWLGADPVRHDIQPYTHNPSDFPHLVQPKQKSFYW
jgi:hypothetical protein